MFSSSSSPSCLSRYANWAFLSGVLFAGGWWIFFDGLMYHSSMNLYPPVDSEFWLPGFLATTGFLLILANPLAHEQTSFDYTASSALQCSRLCFFISLVVTYSSIAVAIGLFDSLRSTYDSDPFFSDQSIPFIGFAVVVQAVLISLAAVTCIVNNKLGSPFSI